jgi:hypothetical protein
MHKIKKIRSVKMFDVPYLSLEIAIYIFLYKFVYQQFRIETIT